jgi:hypothetical protein
MYSRKKILYKSLFPFARLAPLRPLRETKNPTLIFFDTKARRHEDFFESESPNLLNPLNKLNLLNNK